MMIKSVALAGVLACLMLPAWGEEKYPRQEQPMSSKNSVNSVTLKPFMARVWEEHPVVHSAQAAIKAARARGTAANKPLYNPELELDGERTGSNAAYIGMSQSIDWGNKREANTSVAASETLAAEANIAATRQRVAAEVLSALANFQSFQEMRLLAQQRSRFMQRFSQATANRLAAGDIGQLDAALARVAYTEALLQETKIAAEVAAGQAALRAASSLTLKKWPSLPRDIPPKPSLKNKESVLASLPELVLLHARSQAAKARITLAQAERKADPTFGIRGGVDDSDGLIGINLSIPLFVRNSFTAEVEAASQTALQEEAAFYNARQRAEAHLGGSFERYRLMFDAWQVWQETGQSALREQMQLLERMWEAGELGASEYLIQAKLNVDAQEAAVDLATQAWLAWVEWLAASGQVEQWISSAH